MATAAASIRISSSSRPPATTPARSCASTSVPACPTPSATLYRTLYAPHLKPMPGLAEFIAWARSMRIALGLATGGPTVNINFILDGLGLRQSFAAIVGAADVARGKPAPDVYLKAAAGCGALPQDCIVFEDAPLGVAAARNAAMQAVVLTTTLPADSFAGYDNVIAFGSDFTLLARDLFAPGRT